MIFMTARTWRRTSVPVCRAGAAALRYRGAFAGAHLRGHGGKGCRHALPHHGAHVVLRALRLGAPVHGKGRRRGADAGIYKGCPPVRRGAPVHGMGRAPFVQNVTMNAAPRRQRAHSLSAAPARQRCQVVVHEKFHPITPPAAREAACATPWCSTRGSRPLSWWPQAMWQGRAKACGACSAARL